MTEKVDVDDMSNEGEMEALYMRYRRELGEMEDKKEQTRRLYQQLVETGVLCFGFLLEKMEVAGPDFAKILLRDVVPLINIDKVIEIANKPPSHNPQECLPVKPNEFQQACPTSEQNQ